MNLQEHLLTPPANTFLKTEYRGLFIPPKMCLNLGVLGREGRQMRKSLTSYSAIVDTDQVDISIVEIWKKRGEAVAALMILSSSDLELRFGEMSSPDEEGRGQEQKGQRCTDPRT